jgi:hypothetical protein
MTEDSWFAADVGADFEESVRIDREDDGRALGLNRSHSD